MSKAVASGVLGLVIVGVCAGGALADKCGLCKKEIPAGKGVRAEVGKAKKSYRCIHCALSDLESVKGAYTLTAKTPLDHKLVRLSHKSGVWKQEPRSTVFLILPERAGECLDVHQPFATRNEYDRYLKQNPAIAAQKPKPYTISDYEKILKAGRGYFLAIFFSFEPRPFR